MAITLDGTNGITTPDVSTDDGGVYAKGNILGTVSQAAGVPTGAIIERGSNANGEYVKFADGTVYCVINSISVSATAGSGSIFTGTGTSWTLPVTLATTGFIAGGGRVNSTFRWVTVSGVTTSSVNVQLFSSSSTSPLNVLAWVIGRWY